MHQTEPLQKNENQCTLIVMDKNIVLNKKIIISLLIAFFLVLFFWQTETMLKILSDIFALFSPFLLAGAIAFIINVPMRFIEKNLFYRKKSKKSVSLKIARPISLVLAILLLVAIIAFALLVIVPQVQDTVQTLAIALESFLPKARDYIVTLFNNNPEIENFLNSFNFEQIRASVIEFLRTGLLSVFGSTISVATGVVSIITMFFIGVVFALYILVQKEVLAFQFKKFFFAFYKTKKAIKIIDIFSRVEKAFSKFITGQCLEAVILGTLIVISLSIFQIPFAVLIGVVVGFTSIIPIVGAFFGAGISSFLLLIENPIQAVYFLIIFIVIQQIEGNLIYPKVVGDSIGLPAMWVLAAVSIGGTLMGVSGILLCIPLASVLYGLLRETVHTKLKEKDIQIHNTIYKVGN